MTTVVYRYNGVPESEESEMNVDDEVLKLKQGDIITRKGQRWTIANIELTTGVSVPKPVDIVRLFLVTTM